MRCCDCEFRNRCDETEKVLTSFVKCYKRNHLLKEQKTQTNADKIRSMTDEALGKWICSIMSSDCCRWTCPARNMCGLNDNGLVKWLKQSARED